MNTNQVKILLLSLLLVSFGLTGRSQVPQGFNYQAIARDEEGKVLPGLNLKVRIGILQSTEPLIVVWEEEHAVTTNSFGLFKLIVGDPDATNTGGTVGNFSEINWLIQPLYIRTSIYLNENWIVMGDAQLYSVPYAMVAGSFGALPSLGVTGTTSDPLEPLFEVKNKDGQTIFAVYSDGVRVYVGDEESKSAKGGFAVGGFDATKGNQDFLKVTPNSTSILVNSNPSKSVKGGFSVGGYDASKTSTGDFFNITPENYLIGLESGINITEGIYNSFMGYQAGYENTTGSKNYFIGYRAGYNNTSGNNNIFIGDSAGFANTTGYFNTFVGNWTGYKNTSGIKNLFMGFRAGTSNTTGKCNVFLGPDAGGHTTTAWYNTFVGIGAGNLTTTGGYNSYYGINSGYAMKSGSNNSFYGSNSGYWFDGGSGNTFIGSEAGRGGPDNDPEDPSGNYNTLVGSFTGTVLEGAGYNTILGSYAGKNLRTGSYNVFIGYQAGYSELGSNKLYIANSSATPPLIYGDFSSKKVGINTTSLNKTMNVGGDAEITGTLTAASVSAPVTGNVTGNVTGDLTGNVSGDVTGNLTGEVNNVTIGQIFSMNSEELISSNGFQLVWDPDVEEITIINEGPVVCSYWYRIQQGATSTGNSGQIAVGDKVLITGWNVNNCGIEIHFGSTYSNAGWCSLWLQYISKRIAGHYMKF